MSLALPLGLLGLIGIALLILIYILRPNFQQKFVSSTFVWKRALKYKKKRLPVNKFRNILIFLCQLLSIVAVSILLAVPIIKAEQKSHQYDEVLVIDASANMLTSKTVETRFERAVKECKEKANEFLNDGHIVTVILAGNEATAIINKANKDQILEVNETLDSLVEPFNHKCSYGVGDIEGAMKIASDIASSNEYCEVFLYSATEYLSTNDVTVIDCKEEGEYNVAILDFFTEVFDNYYIFYVDLISYGVSTDLLLELNTYGCNKDQASGTGGVDTSLTKFVRLEEGKQTRVEIRTEDEESAIGIYSYESAYCHIDVNDSYSFDNYFYLYDGTQEVIKVEYVSNLANTFINSVLNNIRYSFDKTWDIRLTRNTVREASDYNTIIDTLSGQTMLEGFDLYIFEHVMPDTLPTDGVVFLIDPDKAPENSGIEFAMENIDGTDHLTLASGINHPITSFMTPESIEVTSYKRVEGYADYLSLLFCGGDPVLLLKELANQKVLVLSLNLNTTNFAVGVDFPLMMYNMFDYFFPEMISKHVYEVGESVNVESRNGGVEVIGPESYDFEDGKGNFAPIKTGAYNISQVLLNGNMYKETVYVKAPASESNIFNTVDYLNGPIITIVENTIKAELSYYFLIALAGLLLLEWILHLREGL